NGSAESAANGASPGAAFRASACGADLAAYGAGAICGAGPGAAPGTGATPATGAPGAFPGTAPPDVIPSVGAFPDEVDRSEAGGRSASADVGDGPRSTPENTAPAPITAIAATATATVAR